MIPERTIAIQRDGDAEGWIKVTYKRKGRVSSGEETVQKGTRSRSPTRRGVKSIVSKILQVSKMPRLPADDIKIIVRPRDGLSIRHACRASLDEAIRLEAGAGCEEKRERTPAGSRLTRPGHLGKQPHTTSPSTHIKVQIQVQAGSLGTTSLGVKVQKQTQVRAEIHLEGKDARSDNEAARRTARRRRQGDNRLVIGGDFNAPHTQWGYGHSSKKGKNLADLIEKAEQTILNEPASKTRIGVGPHRDTTPDLTLCKNAGRITWENTFEDLGSDHRILSIALGNPPTRNCKRTIRRVDWDKFRKIRNEKKQGPIENIEEWSRERLRDVEKATTEMEWDDSLARREEEDECGGTLSMRMDSRRLHTLSKPKNLFRNGCIGKNTIEI
ncbi:hypothetical protein HPB51_013561 [Rhipicephalus microplus]|uniref:Endonuclease/exonuclease/phosphatase domain-containing protein n=1 Tax=Rhipicephalus microplus TaxID=6941 RepID=A0A9J6DA91_RHIMP|nr:hypothetical protein HPB51_013561 [Rhipicephalus microplus]